MLKRSIPPQRDHQENEISSPRRASAEIHSALVGGADHRSDGLTLPEARRYLSRARGSISTGILPQRPNCRNPNSLGLMLASRLWPLCRNMSRSCISARCFRQITAPVTVRNFFCCRSFISQARSRMQCHDDMHLLEQGKRSDLYATANCPPWGQRLNHPCQTEHYRNTLSPRHTRHPLHEAANYLYNRYIYL